MCVSVVFGAGVRYAIVVVVCVGNVVRVDVTRGAIAVVNTYVVGVSSIYVGVL